jgi:hypothetical protein
MADMFDEMSDLDEGMGDEPALDEMADTESEIDAEFAMHAAEAGFDTPEKQMALKAAIERCAALKEDGEYEEPEAEMDDMAALGDEDEFAALG